MVDMSHVCDPRNRPGYEPGDPSSHLAASLTVLSAARSDDLRTVLLAWFSAALIVTVVAALVVITS